MVLVSSTATLARSDDFISHVEQTLMTVTDTHSQSETMRQLEDVYAYGDKSRFQDMFLDLNKYYKHDDLYYEYEDDIISDTERNTSIRGDEFEYFTKIGKTPSPTPTVDEEDNSEASKNLRRWFIINIFIFFHSNSVPNSQS